MKMKYDLRIHNVSSKEDNRIKTKLCGAYRSVAIDKNGSFLFLHARFTMKDFSKRFPQALFELHCINEIQWKHWFQNGKDCIQNPDLIFHEFDTSRLED